MFSGELESFVSAPWVGFAFGILVLVLGWRMTTRYANLLLIVAWATLTISAFGAHPIANQAMASRLIGTSVIAAALGLFIYYTLWTESETAAPLLSSQIAEIKELQDFLGGKGESELWELFDLHGITRFNIQRAKAVLGALTHEKTAEINKFFQNGQAILCSTYAKTTRTSGGIISNPLPGQMHILNLSNKYVVNKRKLAAFQSSAQLPSKIQNALSELYSAVETNASLLLDVINDKLAREPNDIVHEDNPKSQRFGATSGAFLDKCIRLKAKQEKVMCVIRKYLRVK